MEIELEFVEELPPNGNAGREKTGKYHTLAEKLKERPGEWAKWPWEKKPYTRTVKAFGLKICTRQGQIYVCFPAPEDNGQ